MQDELAEWLRHGATLLEVIVLKGEPWLPSIQSATCNGQAGRSKGK